MFREDVTDFFFNMNNYNGRAKNLIKIHCYKSTMLILRQMYNSSDLVSLPVCFVFLMPFRYL